MMSYILTGDLELKQNFISDYIEKEDIRNYNLFDYKETLKIAQAREIKKLLSQDALSSKKRLFIIRDITEEAQNALLKTLEELPQDTCFIFLNETILIPTILSRARLLKLEAKRINASLDLSSVLNKFILGEKDIPSSLLLVDELFSQDPNLSFGDLVLSLREMLFDQMKNSEFEKSNLILRLLKSLYKYLPFIENNNLNRRLILERILIAESRTKLPS